MGTRSDPARRPDWRSLRDGIDLAAVATRLLGPAPGRRGERSRRLWWWNCPFHPDNNPSFCVDPGKPWYRCYGCDARGDAASLVMHLTGATFPEAVAHLTGTGPAPSGRPRPRPELSLADRPGPPPESPNGPEGMTPEAAAALVIDAADRLWTPEGADALAYLTGPDRLLTPEAIRAARLGWVPRVQARTRDGRPYSARGVVLPWFAGDRPALVKVRQPEGVKPKYAEVFRDRDLLAGAVYPGPEAIRPGCPLILVEGEFDALLLAQELGELAAVVTLGSASARPDARTLGPLLAAWPWILATDADDAGDRAATPWPTPARRVRPPAGKDWTDARAAGLDLRRWWGQVLAGVESPPLFTWEELASWRWGPDPAPGVVIIRPDPAQMPAALLAPCADPEDAAEREAIRAESRGEIGNRSWYNEGTGGRPDATRPAPLVRP